MSLSSPSSRSSYFPAPLPFRRNNPAQSPSSHAKLQGRTLLAPPPACLNRYSSATPGPAGADDLPHLRYKSKLKLRSAWDEIFEKYKDVDPDLEDEIDIHTGRIVVDRGKLRGLDPREFGEGDETDDANLTVPGKGAEEAEEDENEDEDELGGWGERSGLDIQILDPELLSLVETAAVTQRQWTEADKEDLDTFLSAESHRAPLLASDALDLRESESDDSASPRNRSLSTPGRRLRRTTYSERPEGFFPARDDSDSEDELSLYHPSTECCRLTSSSSMPAIMASLSSDGDFEQPSSPSTSRLAFAATRSRSLTGLSEKARGKLPVNVFGLRATASGRSDIAQRKVLQTVHLADKAGTRNYGSSSPLHGRDALLLRKQTQVTPSRTSSSAFKDPDSLARRVRRLSVRFSPVVTNYPAVQLSAYQSRQSPKQASLIVQKSTHTKQPPLGRHQTPFVPSRSATSLLRTTQADISQCAACVAAGGARALGAATCSGSKEGVECELAAAGRAAELNRLKANRAASVSSAIGMRKRSRVILSPDSDDEASPDKSGDIFGSLPELRQQVPPSFTARPTPVSPLSTTRGQTQARRKKSGPRRSISTAGSASKISDFRPIPIQRVVPSTQLAADDDSSDDELAWTDDKRTQASMEPKPQGIATFARRRSLRPRSPSIVRQTAIGLPTPPPSYSSQSRVCVLISPRVMTSSHQEQSPTKRQRPWSTVSRTQMGPSTPASTTSPSPQRRVAASVPKPLRARLSAGAVVR